MSDKSYISDVFEDIFKLNKPELLKITQEYYELIIIQKLSEDKINRISEILYLAVFDELLDTFISRIDESINKEENKMKRKYRRSVSEFEKEDLYSIKY